MKKPKLPTAASIPGVAEGDPESRIVLAAVAGAHGIAGEVRLKLFAQSVESLSRLTRIEVGDRSLTLASVKPGGGGALARFGEISDRNAAETLRGQQLTIPRSALPPLEEGEYYHADLIGLPCLNQDGLVLGRVVAVENFGAGDILEIEKPDGKRSMVPFREGIASLGEGQIRVDEAFLA